MPRSKFTGVEHLDGLIPGPQATAKSGIKKKMRRDDLEAWDGNPRGERTEEQLHEMGADLEARGQLQQLITRPHPDEEKRALGIEQVVAGVTRFLAGAAPYGDFPIYDVDSRELNDKEALDVAYAENAKRNDMAALDHARYFSRRMAMEGGDEDSLRKVAKTQNMSHERVRQYANLLKLPGLKNDGGFEVGSILGEFARLGLNEKHGRALLMLQGQHELQLNLLRVIERTISPSKPNARLSGNAAIERAEKMLADQQKDGDAAPETTSQKSAGKQSSLRFGNADDADFAENDERLASRDHESRAQKAGKGGVGESAPASSGSGFATASGEGHNLKPAQLKADFVEDELRPAVENLRAVVRRLREQTPLSPDAEARLEKLLTPIQAVSSEIFNAVDFSRKLREIDKKADESSAISKKDS